MKTDANTLTQISYLIIYFIPTLISFARRRKDGDLIFLFNVWFAWTGIGWIVAIVWAFRRNRLQGPDRYFSRPLNQQIDLEEFHRQRLKYLYYKQGPEIDYDEIEYQLRRRRVPSVCDRCGEADPCICTSQELKSFSRLGV